MQKILKMTPNHIKRLIAEGEHQTLDFKFEISDCRKIARSLVAFANTDGGRLLIGVKDNGVISGIRSDEEKHMIETAAKMYCKPEVQYTAKAWDIDGKTVLEIIIPKSHDVKHKAPDPHNIYKVYMRCKDENILASSIQIKAWKRQRDKNEIKITFTEEEKMLLKYLDEHRSISFDEFLEISNLKKRDAENILADFIAIGMIQIETSGKGNLFSYGVLA